MKSIGRYAIESVLGEGGMGTVYVARDPVLDRRVALKTLKADALGSSSSRARMIREARVMAKLVHPNIVTLYDADEVEGVLYIALELVEGGTLQKWLAVENRSNAEVLNAFTESAKGLAAAHAAGIVHRDFKPANVLVGRDGRVMVTDFGIASSAMDESDWGDKKSDRNAPITHVGAVMGTPAYMAPEQYLGVSTDARTDQFSFAVALHQALYGFSPFEGDTFESRKASVLAGRVRFLDPVQRARVPESVHATLARALAVDPSRRFASMHDLIASLTPPPPVPQSAVGPVLAGIGLWLLLAALIVVPTFFLLAPEDAAITALDDPAVVRERLDKADWTIVSTVSTIPAADQATRGQLAMYTVQKRGEQRYAYVSVYVAPKWRTSFWLGNIENGCRLRHDATVMTRTHLVCAGSPTSSSDGPPLLAAVTR